jgi:hypothetical protein
MRFERQQIRRLQRSSLTRLHRWWDMVELARGLRAEDALVGYSWQRSDHNEPEEQEMAEREDEEYVRESEIGRSLFEDEDIF